MPALVSPVLSDDRHQTSLQCNPHQARSLAPKYRRTLLTPILNADAHARGDGSALR